MTRITIISALCLLTFLRSSANGIEAFFSYTTFYSHEEGPYVETYITMLGETAQYMESASGNWYAEVEVKTIITGFGRDVYLDRHVLRSPPVANEKDAKPNFLDMQRIPLANGTYEVTITIQDLHSDKEPQTTSFNVTVDCPADEVFISDIELVDSYEEAIGPPSDFTKSGLEMIPYAMDYYPESIDKITYYAEIYHTDAILGAGQRYLANIYIESDQTRAPMANLSRFKKQVTAPTNALFGEFPLDKVYSGDFHLVIEVRDTTNQLLAITKRYFQRSQPAVSTTMADVESTDITLSFATTFHSKDTLIDYIRSLRPISNERDLVFADNAIASDDIELMQKYFHSFWLSRNPEDPAKAWKEYKVKVDEVNEKFGTRLSKGYDTDRGRVYLQYGAPNSIAKSYNEPSAYPYEIWHYYMLGAQPNRRFIFYNPDLVTDEFALLHSDAKGEVFNSQWEQVIHKRTTPMGNLDDQGSPGHMGGRSSDLYRNPR